MSMTKPARPEVQAVFKAVQVAITGHDATDAIIAMVESVSLLIGMSAADQRGAQVVVDAIGKMLRASVVSNWDQARQLREKSLLHASPGTSDRVN